VDIVGFEVIGGARHGGIDNGGSNVRILGNFVHDIPGPGCAHPNGAAGINNYRFSESDSDIIGNVVARIGDPARPCGLIHGIYHSNLRGRIWNNVTFQNSGYGIHTWHAAREVVIANNLVFANGGGILVGAGDSPGGIVADNFVVTNNIVIDNGYDGITEWGNIGVGNRFVNNLVSGNRLNVRLRTRHLGTMYASPRFVEYRRDGTGDYRLRDGSAGTSAGTNLGAPSYDFLGFERPRDRTPNLGPFDWLGCRKHDASRPLR
jgi:hypothetical protein